MELRELMIARRTRRRYNGQPIAAQTLDEILEAGLLAPTGRNLHPNEIVVVRDKAMLAHLAKAKTGGSTLLENADAALVVCGDSSRSDTWIEDGAIMMAYMQLAAENLGVGNCWVQIRLRESQTLCADGSRLSSSDYVRHALGLAEGIAPLAILALGMSDEVRPPHTDADIDREKIHHEHY